MGTPHKIDRGDLSKFLKKETYFVAVAHIIFTSKKEQFFCSCPYFSGLIP